MQTGRRAPAPHSTRTSPLLLQLLPLRSSLTPPPLPDRSYVEKVVADFAGYVDVTYVHAGVPPPPPPPGAM